MRRLLIVDSDAAARRVAHFAMRSLAEVVVEAESGEAALAAIDAAPCDAALVSLDEHDAADAVTSLRLAGYEGGIVATSARGSLALAVEAMRAGAQDFLPKPFSQADLAARIVRAAPRPLAPPSFAGFEGFVGASPVMREIYRQIERVAPSRAPVFITGESGTGKEVTAQALHRRSGREANAIVALNCGAIPRDLMESEIFGHVKGAFTGAGEDRPGAAELAHGGTLFLDEICEMDLALQTKLLRLVQTGEVRRVGGQRTRRVDVRFICATNRDPLAEVERGRFREDLYYRLCVLPLHLPPLRDRGDDVVALARAFLARFAEEERRAFQGFAPEAERLLASYDWPGNVRQLQNVIRRIVVMHDAATVSAQMLPLALAHGGGDTTPPAAAHPTRIAPFWMQERRIIEEALAAYDGNLSRAAAALEIAPSTIYRKREAWGRVDLAEAG